MTFKIFQVQTLLTSASSNLKDIDNLLDNKNAIRSWATDKSQYLESISQKPAKLRPEAAQNELQQVNTIMTAFQKLKKANMLYLV